MQEAGLYFLQSIQSLRKLYREALPTVRQKKRSNLNLDLELAGAFALAGLLFICIVSFPFVLLWMVSE